MFHISFPFWISFYNGVIVLSSKVLRKFIVSCLLILEPKKRVENCENVVIK